MSSGNSIDSTGRSDLEIYCVHEVSREVYDHLKANDFDPASKRKISTLEKYSEPIADAIDSLEKSYPRNSDIRNSDEIEVERKGMIGESLNFLHHRYGIGEKYTENNQYTRWNAEAFETDGIRNIAEVLEGFTEALD
jgi:hypothetical protein